MRIDKNTTIRLGNRNIVKVKLGDVVIWQKTTEPVVEPEYFYIESLTDGNTVKLITYLRNTLSSSYITPTIEYSTDKQNWTTITFDLSTTDIKNINIPVVLNTGDKMYFRNDTGKFSRTIYNSGSYETSYITFTTDWQGRVNVGGDIRTLINYRNVDNTILEDGMFSNLFSHTYSGTTTAKIVDASNLKLPFTELTRYCYYSMFGGCDKLTTTPTLPATTLANNCYNYMFKGCSSLTTLPELPATTLVTRCYEGMFRGCTKLTTVPTLQATTLAEMCYSSMFMGCTSLTTAPELPATTLASSCYSSMFQDCSSLTSAPALPATTLVGGCYDNMFRDCTSLTTAPALPATIMQYNCYRGMFWNCNSLTTAPTLPATTLNNECYQYMFYGCKALTTAPALPATTLNNGCYQYMFNGCTSLTTAPTLPATTLAMSCYKSMFNGCTSLTTAPALPATNLADNCYDGMFNGCSNLNKVLTYADDISTSNCTTNWLNNVASSGILYNAGSAVYTTDSPSGIPTGWTEVTTVPTTSVYAVPNTFTAKSWMDKVKLKYTIMGVNETGIDVPLGEQNELITIGKNTGSSTVAHTETFTYDSLDYTITINQTANDTDEPDYFYIESLGDGNTVSVINVGNGSTKNVTPTLEYSKDKNTWNSITFDWASGEHTTELPIALNTGGKMYFRNDTRKFSNSDSKYITFSSSVSSNVGGDIRTLSNYLDVDNETEPQKYMFNSLFYNNQYIVDASNLRLPYTSLAEYCYDSMFRGCSSLTTVPTLPATTLAKYCYSSMFSGCTSLTTTPTLPATTLSNYCYISMFSGCTSLTTAPALPATNLADYCYNSMFYDCSKLTTAPALPATTLASGCYRYMFYGCSKLTTAPALPATTLADYCYESMFYGCSILTTAPALPATTLADYCYNSMFYGCYSLTTAPALPATTLADYCYDSMFYGCSKLTSAPALPATTLADYCYNSMFYGCSKLTSAPALPATNLRSGCYENMFRGCSKLTTAPELPATTLADSCYRSIFENCTSLTSVTIYATDASNYSHSSWLNNVAPSGTVYNNGFLDLPKNSASGIPNGWTEVVPEIQSITVNPNTFTIEFNNETVTCNSTLEVVTTVGTFTKTNSVTLTVGENTGSTTRTITETIPYYNSSYDVTIVQSAIQSITANPDTFTIKSYKDTVKCVSTLTIATTLGTTVTDTNSATITVGENTGDTTRTLTETIPYKGSSYQVTIVQTANDVKPVTSWDVVSTGTYPFQLNSNGYYESTNKGHDSSYSYATLNYEGFENLVLECINSGESNFDYGLISQPDVQLGESTSDDGATGSTNVFHNFKGESSTNPVQLTIPSDGGSHFITIKFRKNSSQAAGNDSLQFKVIEP